MKDDLLIVSAAVLYLRMKGLIMTPSLERHERHNSLIRFCRFFPSLFYIGIPPRVFQYIYNHICPPLGGVEEPFKGEDRRNQRKTRL